MDNWPKPKVIFRADGNSRIGLGHVIRSLALAEMLGEHFNCHFFIRDPLPALEKQILAVCEDMTPLPVPELDEAEAYRLVEDYLRGDEIVVLDGYHFKTDYQRVIKDKGCKLVCIDDIHAYYFLADVVINHGGGITKRNYSAEPYTHFCLGLDYALLRKPFWQASDQQETEGSPFENRILLCLGGADPNNVTLALLKQSLNKVSASFRVVVGAAYQYWDELQAFVNNSGRDIVLLRQLSATQLAGQMKVCGRAITSASAIAYEYACIGGDLYLEQIAKNQEGIYRFFQENGLADRITNFPVSDELQISRKREQQRQAFDGLQAKRLRAIFQDLVFSLDPVIQADVDFLFQLANDPMVRKNSYHTEDISYPIHLKWLARKMDSASTFFYIAKYMEQPIGQIRFEEEKEEVVLGLSLAAAARGKGLGSLLLQKGVNRYLSEESPKKVLVGYVKKQNQASLLSFEKAGFTKESTDVYPESVKFTYSY